MILTALAISLATLEPMFDMVTTLRTCSPDTIVEEYIQDDVEIVDDTYSKYEEWDMFDDKDAQYEEWIQIIKRTILTEKLKEKSYLLLPPIERPTPQEDTTKEAEPDMPWKR